MMSFYRRLGLTIALSFGCTLAGGAETPRAGEDATRLDPFVVEGAPLGFIGVKHFSATTGLRGIVSRNAKLKALTITEVIEGSPAAIAGLAAGDRVRKINGTAITLYSLAQLMKLAEAEPGQKIILEVSKLENQAPRQIEITVGKHRVKAQDGAAGK